MSNKPLTLDEGYELEHGFYWVRLVGEDEVIFAVNTDGGWILFGYSECFSDEEIIRNSDKIEPPKSNR